MGKIVLIYDDTVEVNDRIKTIIGDKSFGNIILKRKTLFMRTQEIVDSIKDNIEIVRIQYKKSFDIIEKFPRDTIVFHLLSSVAIIDIEQFKIILEKLKYIKETMSINCEETIGIAFYNKDDYINFLEEYLSTNEFDYKTENKINATNVFLNLSEYNNLITYISNGFDARYFNSLQGNKYIVTKKSKNKTKMKMEYTFYWLLPESMKNWMVMPYDYKEEKDFASYTMERMPMTDVAIRWTHGAIDIEEFKNLLDKVFYFFSARSRKNISKEQYDKYANKLYIEKVDERIEEFKKLDEYKNIKNLIESATEFKDIDEIIDYYKKLYKVITIRRNKFKFYSVIGHGDIFFANMLYSKELNFLRLIDPKGALKKEDLWTDPYYDIAKLSHSICGNYDFFNVDSYDIRLNNQMKLELEVYFDNSIYKEIYKEYLKKEGYDYIVVRLYEASLFLSMLPLHIDNPRKVLGFLLNAINILKEIEKNV